MKRILPWILVIFLALIFWAVSPRAHGQPMPKVGVCVEPFYTDSARAIREEALAREIGFTGIRTELPFIEIVNRDGTLSSFGPKCWNLLYSTYRGYFVWLTLQWDDSLPEAYNVIAALETAKRGAIEGVEGYFLGNEPKAYFETATPEQKDLLRKKVKLLAWCVQKEHPGAILSAPTLHGWYERPTASDENLAHRTREQRIWAEFEFCRTFAFSTSLYSKWSTAVKARGLIRSTVISEVNREPGGIPMSRAELLAVHAVPGRIRTFFYCLSSKSEHELMTTAGVRNEARISALKAP